MKNNYENVKTLTINLFYEKDVISQENVKHNLVLKQ